MMELKDVYYYTTQEGGEWRPFIVDDTEFEEKLLMQLMDKRRWWWSRIFRQQRTALTCVPHYLILYVHSVKFPDGRIWDSHFRGFDPSISGKHAKNN